MNDIINDRALKPCPFCGGEAYIMLVEKKSGVDFGATFEVGCNRCECSFREESRWHIDYGRLRTDKDGYMDCLERWNRRADNG